MTQGIAVTKQYNLDADGRHGIELTETLNYDKLLSRKSELEEKIISLIRPVAPNVATFLRNSGDGSAYLMIWYSDSRYP